MLNSRKSCRCRRHQKQLDVFKSVLWSILNLLGQVFTQLCQTLRRGAKDQGIRCVLLTKNADNGLIIWSCRSVSQTFIKPLGWILLHSHPDNTGSPVNCLESSTRLRRSCSHLCEQLFNLNLERSHSIEMPDYTSSAASQAVISRIKHLK